MHILIGYGEVGKGIYEAFKDYHDIDIHDPAQNLHAGVGLNYELMLVAIPYNEDFVDTIKTYQQVFYPKHTIIFSTVPIGISGQLGASHSPIEGRHDKMGEYLRAGRHWLGGNNQEAISFFINAGLSVMVCGEPEQTEFLKLRSTTIYGINIEFARYCAKVGKELKMASRVFEAYDRDYNLLNINMDRAEYVRYVLQSPKGKIGGHCVLPNAEILQEQYPHPFIQAVLDFNKED